MSWAAPSWAQPAFPPVDDAGPGVLLGFADGSQLALDPASPHALALRSVADLLTRGVR